MVNLNGVEIDEKEAIKEIRRIRREEKKREEAIAADRAMAYKNAAVNMKQLVHHIGNVIEGGSENWFTRDCNPKIEGLGHKYRIYNQSYDTAHGHGTFSHIGYRPFRTIESAEGPVAVIIVNESTNEQEYYTVGCHNGQVALEEIPYFLHDYILKIDRNL